MKFVDMLLNFGVKPVLVFDGRNLPSKHEVEKARREWVFTLVMDEAVDAGHKHILDLEYKGNKIKGKF